MTKNDLEKFFKMIDRHAIGIRQNSYDPIKYKAIFYLSYRYGLRRGETVALNIDDILEGQTIKIRRLKGSISKVYPLSSDLVPVIKAWTARRLDSYRPNGETALFITNPPSCRRMTDAAIAKMFRILIEEAGLKSKGYHFHSLRHSIAVHALEAGLHIEYVQDLLGHKSIQSTLIYAKIMDTTRNKYMSDLAISSSIVRLP